MICTALAVQDPYCTYMREALTGSGGVRLSATLFIRGLFRAGLKSPSNASSSILSRLIRIERLELIERWKVMCVCVCDDGMCMLCARRDV